MAEGEPKKPPGTKRIVAAGAAGAPRPTQTTTPKRVPAPATKKVERPRVEAEPKVEVVVSSDEHPAVQPKERGPAERNLKGLSVRWKIVVAMAAVTIVTAILIFFVVYSRAETKLNDEIDAKGVKLCNLLASIDHDYWYLRFEETQITQDELDGLIRKLGKATEKPDALTKVHTDAKLRERYKRVLDAGNNAGGWKVVLENPEAPTLDDILSEALEGSSWKQTLASLPPNQNLEEDGPRLRKIYDAVRKKELFEKSKLAPLASFKKTAGDNSDVINIVVNTKRGAIFARTEGSKEVSLKTGKIPLEGGKVLKGDDVPYTESGKTVRARSFSTTIGEGERQIQFIVLLSLAQIDEAKGDLKTAIFLPILVAVIAGVGIAIWISTLITKPLNQLMSDIDEVSQGNLDHETVPSSKDEIGLLATTFNRMTGALKVAHEAELEQKKIEHQMGIAREIQENLMPKRILKIPGYDIGAFYRPSQEVGGDYYDFIDVDEDHAGIIVADVSGKGVPGAIVMSMALAFIREEVDRTHNISPMATLTRANRMLAMNIKKGMFVTAMYCILDKKTHQMSVSSAGHNPLVVWRAATNAVELVNPSGIALGFDKGPVFERTVKEEKVVLERGDRIVAYTDGTVEAMNEADEEFGDKNFYQLAQQLATRDSNQFLNLIIKRLDEHKGNAPQHDDMTIVTLRYL